MHETPYDDYSFTCRTCGQVHIGLPDLAFDYPWHYHVLTEAERAARAVLTSDTCSIEDRDFFVRGYLEIPIHDRSQPFAYGVWVSLSREHFDRFLELYDEKDRLPQEPWFGWLCNRIPGYPDTLHLKTNVHLRPHPTRPYIELEPTDHPLALEQRSGITLRRLQDIVEQNHHPRHAV
jgi:hypothetical protein